MNNNMDFEYNKVYIYDLTGKISFSDISENELCELFKDGRVSSHFLQIHLTKWFNNFKYIDGKGIDHLHKDGSKFEMKCFTKGGCKLVPSNMIGTGRNKNVASWKKHINDNNLTYIITDIVDFPKIRVIFKNGIILTNLYPSGEIKFKQRNELFKEDMIKSLDQNHFTE